MRSRAKSFRGMLVIGLQQNVKHKWEEINMETNKLEEPILEDNYPVHCGYLYVVEIKTAGSSFLTVISSDIQGTVADLRVDLESLGTKNILAIRRCDISGRNLWHLMV